MKKRSGPNEASSGLNGHRGHTIPVAMLLILVVLISAGSGVYAGASFFAQQAPGVTVTTTIYTTTTSWTTSTIWSTVTEVVQGIQTTVEYTTSTSTVTVTGPDLSTGLLLHMDGTDGSQVFVDSSPQARSITARGNAQIDTAQSEFGGASGLFDGNGDYLSLADSADWAFGSGDFTIDFWVRFAALPAAGTYMNLYSQAVGGNNHFSIGVNNNAGTYRLYFVGVTGGSTYFSLGNTARDTSPNLTTGAWYHIALVRSGSSFYWFQNGSQLGATYTDSHSIPDYAAPVIIGCYSGVANYFNGWLDEFRVSKGIARWTSNFTPPATPY